VLKNGKMVLELDDGLHHLYLQKNLHEVEQPEEDMDEGMLGGEWEEAAERPPTVGERIAALLDVNVPVYAVFKTVGQGAPRHKTIMQISSCLNV